MSAEEIERILLADQGRLLSLIAKLRYVIERRHAAFESLLFCAPELRDEFLRQYKSQVVPDLDRLEVYFAEGE